jgi:hypothetical protein
VHRDGRKLTLSSELDNDKLQLKNDLLDRDLAKLHGKRWEMEEYKIHSTAELDDLLRAQIDEWLENTFPSLPQIPLDEYADQLDSRIRTAKSSKDAEKFLSQLQDLQKYVYSLNNGAEPSEDRFTREIARRAGALPQ